MAMTISLQWLPITYAQVLPIAVAYQMSVAGSVDLEITTLTFSILPGMWTAAYYHRFQKEYVGQ